MTTIGDFVVPLGHGPENLCFPASLSPQPGWSPAVFPVLSAALGPSLYSAQTAPFPPRCLEGPLIVFYFSLSQKPLPEVFDQGSQHVPLKQVGGRKILYKAD